ncbi:MAG: sodium:proton antiporter [Desulfobacterales bacterium]|nr:sodium:proton antiporter [Desulfobacterales bacterium]MDJ0914163.1 sodium:proton antiporter [Desulfobacterales bacterium]
MEILTAFAIGLTFALGLFQILRRNVIRAAIGLMLLTNAVNLFLLSAGAYTGKQAAYVGAVGIQSDALPQALVLTAVVIGLGVTAFVLAMLIVIVQRYKSCDSDEVRGLKR